MSSDRPRLRGSAQRRSGPYPLGQVPDDVLLSLGRQVVHRLAIGAKDISGSDFGDMFARAIDGNHRDSPLGVADVVLGECAWSVKTVKSSQPFKSRDVRLISGRNSPDYSSGIRDFRADPTRTGAAVLDIWNARVDEALAEYRDLRIVVLIRNLDARQFVLFEEEALRFAPTDFHFNFNRNENLEGRDRVSEIHHFTWQPHGSQFTVKRAVPGSARQFSIIRHVPIVVSESSALKAIDFDDDWIKLA